VSKELDSQNVDQEVGDSSLNEGVNQESSPDVKDRPAPTKAQNILVIVIMVAVIGIISYYFFGSSSDNKKQASSNNIPLNNKPQTSGDIPVPQVFSSGVPSGNIDLSPPKPKEENKMQPLPPSPPGKETPKPEVEPTAVVANNAQNLQAKQARLKSNMMLTNSANVEPSKSAKPARSVTNNFSPSASSATHTEISQVGDLTYTIAQGKIMECVLETPINTKYPGPVRAVLSKDVYSEKGDNVLIPKGSRLIGTFSQGITAGDIRVAVSWTRIIMPNGYDINITNALGVDNLGDVGVKGDIHREFFGIIGNAVLLSVMNIALASEAQKRYNIQSSNTTTSTNTSTGNTTTTSTNSPVQQAGQQEVARLGSVTEQWFRENFQVKPFITINQGTLVKVFVNEDIQFPKKLYSDVNNLG
jgi:type IV secretion system protein VirB10